MILASASPDSLLTGMSAAFVYVALAWWGGRLSAQHAQRLIWIGWLLHGLSVALSLGSSPDGVIRFGFAPALSATA